MQLSEAIRERRAVREYQDVAVPEAEIEALVNAAIQAPSAMNLQPWAFAVLRGRERIDRYGQRVKSWLLEESRRHALDAAALEILLRPDFTIFHHAPALVLVLATSTGAQAAEDCCLAAQNLMLAARDQGLGTCWIGFARPWLNLIETKQELGLPHHWTVIAPIILGYPAAWPQPHGRKSPEILWLR